MVTDMKIAKRVAAVVLFLALLTGIMGGVNWLFQMKDMDGCYPVRMFYKQEKNTVDVLCLGSSHTYTNINPAVLWDEYGIASYNLAGSNQPLWNSYYYFKEALKYQTPELVVLDVYRAIETDDYQDEARTVMNTFGLRYSKDWMENLEVSLSPTASYMDYFLRFPVYHSRYQELKQSDFKLYNGDVNGENYKGFNLKSVSTTVFGEYPDVSAVTEVGEMTEKTREYLEKIILLAQENDVPLLLVSAPYMGGVLEDKEIYNQVELIAEAYGVEFIDFNEHYTDIGLDLERDFAEWSHLNYDGSEKYTRYLGKIMTENYDVSDHRGDVRYDSWEKNARFYEKQAYNVALTKSEEKEEYLQRLFERSDRYTICVNVAGDCHKDVKKIGKLLKKYGMDMEENSTWIFRGGELLYTLPVDKEITEASLFYENLGENSVSVSVEMGYDAVKGVFPYKKIVLEGTNCNAAERGINILVYDNEFQAVVDNVGLNADNNYEFCRF